MWAATGKGSNLGEVSMLFPKSLERQTAEACLPTALPSVGATSPFFSGESAQCILVFTTEAQLFPIGMLFCCFVLFFSIITLNGI